MESKPILVLSYEGKTIQDYSKIIQKMHSDEIKQITISLSNISKTHHVENIKFITNMPKDAYSAIIPKNIKPQGSGHIKISLDASVLYHDETINAVAIEITYDEVKFLEAR